jgi:hypothetical protein
MGIRADIRDRIRKEMVTKIHGHQANQDLSILEKELIAILANIPTTLREGNHGHVGIIIETTRYLLMTGTAFVNPPNPGTNPTNVAGNVATRVQAQAEGEHKEETKEYETFQGVIQATKDIILKAVRRNPWFSQSNPNSNADPPKKQRRSLGICRHQNTVSRMRWRIGRQQSPTTILQQG